jgi:hypothetical protein
VHCWGWSENKTLYGNVLYLSHSYIHSRVFFAATARLKLQQTLFFFLDMLSKVTSPLEKVTNNERINL